MSNLGERITILRNYKNMNQKEFSEFIECPRSSLSEIENGKRSPNIELIVGISNRCKEINIDWLLTGEGEMQKALPSPLPPTEERRVAQVDRRTLKMQELLDGLDMTQQQEILSAITEKKRINEMQRQLDQLINQQARQSA